MGSEGEVETRTGVEITGARGLPAWGHDDLPEPLPFSFGNMLRTIGPGAILLATSIGGGEWLVGPAMGVQFGTGIFWVATVAIVLQLIFNLEGIRYTLYTGEPIYSGFMRLKPSSNFWSIFYVILASLQLGLPALASACASVLFAAFLGQMPGAPDARTLVLITYGVMMVTVLILLFGGTIERMLEYASWAMLAYTFVFLLTVNIFFVPLANWGRTLVGFFSFGYVPAGGVDILLLGALAASAGSGGIGNLTITNWVRDKGFGMGGRVGAIPSAIGSHEIKLSHVGKVFPVNSENMRRWKLWWKYLEADQVWLWGAGCFVGMFLNVNLATAIIPPGADISQVGAGAFQAQYMSQLWTGFWFLALLNGFWILFSTHLGNTDILIRTLTDIIWVGSRKARSWRGGDIRKIYYGLLLIFTVWGMIAVNWKDAMGLFKILANIAGVVLAISSIQILFVNTKLLPTALQPSAWRKAALVMCSLFYATLAVMVFWSQVKSYF